MRVVAFFMGKIPLSYPEIEKNPPTFEPEDGPQLNL